MRGLDARLMIAKHRIRLVIGLDARAELIEARHLARRLGFADAIEGRRDPPALFNDEPLLLQSWRDEQREFFEIPIPF